MSLISPLLGGWHRRVRSSRQSGGHGLELGRTHWFSLLVPKAEGSLGEWGEVEVKHYSGAIIIISESDLRVMVLPEPPRPWGRGGRDDRLCLSQTIL